MRPKARKYIVNKLNQQQQTNQVFKDGILYLLANDVGCVW